MLEIWAAQHRKHATCTVLRIWLGQCTQNLGTLVMQSRCRQCSHLQLKMLPKKMCLLRFGTFQGPSSPARASIMSTMGPVFAPNRLLDFSHKRFHLQSTSSVEVSKSAYCEKRRPMLALKKFPQTLRSVGKPQQRHQKTF